MGRVNTVPAHHASANAVKAAWGVSRRVLSLPAAARPARPTVDPPEDPMPSNVRYANGHRRRELRARKLAAGGYCPWPDCPWPHEYLGAGLVEDIRQRVPVKPQHDPHYPEVDEIIPVSRGGDPVAADNTRLLHRRRWCNQQRGAGRTPTRNAPRPTIIASPGWGPSATTDTPPPPPPPPKGTATPGDSAFHTQSSEVLPMDRKAVLEETLDLLMSGLRDEAKGPARAPLAAQIRAVSADLAALSADEGKAGDPVDELAARRAARGGATARLGRATGGQG
ncbi:hypothetical protein GCM10025875_36220 [Litorihabitans aurantiacus]|uniref:Uncharacterized protein n=1 Tax=Litorihabitans aurantiacus TaxID=1930061 RepID=A0AA37XHY7_9MICO|nr:hypothetical protein GCM10025875_36220 [Litorihabitans aurantiacus]